MTCTTSEATGTGNVVLASRPTRMIFGLQIVSLAVQHHSKTGRECRRSRRFGTNPRIARSLLGLLGYRSSSAQNVLAHTAKKTRRLPKGALRLTPGSVGSSQWPAHRTVSNSPPASSRLPVAMSSGSKAYAPRNKGKKYRFMDTDGKWYVGILVTVIESIDGMRAVFKFGNGEQLNVRYLHCYETEEDPSYMGPAKSAPFMNVLAVGVPPGMPPAGTLPPPFPMPGQALSQAHPSGHGAVPYGPQYAGFHPPGQNAPHHAGAGGHCFLDPSDTMSRLPLPEILPEVSPNPLISVNSSDGSGKGDSTGVETTEVAIAPVSKDEPIVTRKELWSYYLYYNGDNGVGPNGYSMTLFQSLATAAGYDPVKGPGSDCSASDASGQCVLPWGSGTKAVSSVVLVSNGVSFAVSLLRKRYSLA
ncbi:hypothetical protein NUW54_g7713 [Trametes sanguinea]|uniref:Uncharacterized protein n=1 Tax=Trametes sanguinea TaxID=158606 RepID=A0ACC1PKK2_9APHY|nr:hypothetical protein NUW54_g7713 [Trametes sanguinea]